jgi:hypothetical protein
MITCKQLVREGFVEIGLSRKIGRLYGARITYATGTASFKPCAIYVGRDVDSLLESNSWEWNEAVLYGNVKMNGAPKKLYWNLFLNGLHTFEGAVQIRADVLTKSGVTSHEKKLVLKRSDASYVKDWQRFIPQESGWKVVDGQLTIEGKEGAPPVRVRPCVEGRYTVSLGLFWGALHAMLKVSEEPNTYPIIATHMRPEFQAKINKEIVWKTVDLKRDSSLDISQMPHAARHPELYPFGYISYIKLTPETAPARRKPPRWQDKKLAFYFEPWSWAGGYGLERKSEMKEVLSLFREMGADEIHTQVTRFGSKTLHYSRVAEITEGELLGDDGTHSPGMGQLVQSMDALSASIEVCKELGMEHYANAGLTMCYPGTGDEEKISREHPEWRHIGVHKGVLDFNRTQTRSYACAIVKEFVEWGTDGVSIDCMRYPYYHTEDDLLALFREMHEIIKQTKSDGNVPLTVRIPAGDTTYYRAFEQLAKEGRIQCVIPSTIWSWKPFFSLKPYLEWKDLGCRIYGRIDGWKENIHGNNSTPLNPGDVKKDIRRYLKEGADGIFVYQADTHLADPFNRPVLDWRKW